MVHTADSHFGAGQSAFHVTKPLVLEPSLPAFANITDRLIARGVVLNQTTNSGEVIVSLELDDKVKITGSGQALTRRVPVPAHGSVVVEFPVEFTDTGESNWVWRARFADPAVVDFTDAVQSTIPVGHIAPVMGEVLLRHAAELPANLLALANPQLLAGRGTITVSVANTRLSELGETAASSCIIRTAAPSKPAQVCSRGFCCGRCTACCRIAWVPKPMTPVGASGPESRDSFPCKPRPAAWAIGRARRNPCFGPALMGEWCWPWPSAMAWPCRKSSLTRS